MPRDDEVERLASLLRAHPIAGPLLERLPALGLPSWYLGAGGVAQTVWNHQHGFAATHGIADYDVVYFDPADRTETGERAVEAEVSALVRGSGARVDVTNEARVHEWYEERFGRALAPYGSAEEAIATWPTTATSVGVRQEDGRFVVCAPFGLGDVFSMTVRANTALVDRSVYEAKAERWRSVWSRLTVLPWPAPISDTPATRAPGERRW